MASKIKKGTLTVRISEDVVLNGQQQGGTNILTIPWSVGPICKSAIISLCLLMPLFIIRFLNYLT